MASPVLQIRLPEAVMTDLRAEADARLVDVSFLARCILVEALDGNTYNVRNQSRLPPNVPGPSKSDPRLREAEVLARRRPDIAAVSDAWDRAVSELESRATIKDLTYAPPESVA